MSEPLAKEDMGMIPYGESPPVRKNGVYAKSPTYGKWYRGKIDHRGETQKGSNYYSIFPDSRFVLVPIYLGGTSVGEDERISKHVLHYIFDRKNGKIVEGPYASLGFALGRLEAGAYDERVTAEDKYK